MALGAVLADRFELERLAGAGAMGRVYRARDRLTGKAVAVKILFSDVDEAAGERFAREVRVLASIEHPGVVGYVAHGIADLSDAQTPYLAMDWLDGETLRDRISKKPLTVLEAVALGIRLADTLGALHEKGLVHRDLKPGNVFLVGGSVEGATILDLGVVRLPSGDSAITQTGALIGTPGYIAPEQARGEPDIDARADVFALGCLLFRCIAGKPAFDGEDVLAVLLKVALEEAPRLSEHRPDVPDALDHLVARMLSKRRENRPENGAVAAQELRRILETMDDTPAPSSRAPRSITATERRVVCLLLVRSERRSGEISSLRITAPSGSSPAMLLGPSSDPIPSPRPSRSSAEEAPGDPKPQRASPESERARTIREIVSQHGGTVEIYADGSMVAAFATGRAATDIATSAARCALRLRRAFTGVRAMMPNIAGFPDRASASEALRSFGTLSPLRAMALVAGREVLQRGLPMGEMIDRAVRLLAQASVWSGPADIKNASLTPIPAARASASSLGREPDAGPPRPPESRDDTMVIPVDDVVAGLLDGRFEVGESGDLLFLRGERDAPEVGRTLLGKPTPCVGRDKELALLTGLFQETVEEGVARAVLVTGASGIGKSRIRYEFVRALRDRGEPLELWLSRGDPMAARAPFSMLGQAIRRAAGVLEGEGTAGRQRKLRARLSRHLTGETLQRCLEFLGALSGVGDGPQVSALRHNPMLLGDQMRRAWEDWLAIECAAQPVVLILEDLHWGDLPTVKFVDAALRNLKEARLFVLALGRPEVREMFPNLWEGRRITELVVGELTRRSSEAIVRSVLGDDVDSVALGELVQRAAGNALYLEELIRSFAEGTRETAPETVLAMVHARLEGLDAETRRTLRAASVFGTTFWRGGVEDLLGGPEAAPYLEASLARLVDRELVLLRAEGRSPHEDELQFRHGLVREAAYGMLTDEDRVLGHRLAGAWLAAHGDADAAVLAEHFERGQDPERALRWYLRAAEQALGGNDLAAAIDVAERGSRCGAKGDDLAALRLVQGDAHEWRGEHAETARCATEVLALVARGTPLWYRAMGSAARVCGRLGARPQLAALAEELTSPPLDPSAIPLYVGAAASAAIQLMYAGEHALGTSLMERVEADAAAVMEHDPLVAGQIWDARAVRALCEGNLAADAAAGEQAIRAFDEAGDFRGSCHSLVNLGYTYYSLGDHGRAVAVLERALALSERTGTFTMVALAKHNLGAPLARLGDAARGAALERDAVRDAAEHGDVRFETGARVYLARILRESGDLQGAEREAEAAVTVAPPGSPLRAYALAVLGDVLLARGRFDDAAAAAREGFSLLEHLGSIDDGDAFVHVVRVETQLATGDTGGARGTLAIARQRLLDRAAKITSPAWQRSFLSDVPENARTLALALRLLGSAPPPSGR